MNQVVHFTLPWSFETSRRNEQPQRNLTSRFPVNFPVDKEKSELRNVKSSVACSTSESNEFVLERYESGKTIRYSLNEDDAEISSYLEHESFDARTDYSDSLFWLPKPIREFVFPAGFPGSVSNDYLQYMLLQFPTNVTGWICHALVTSSLLKAVGISSFTGTEAAASAAAIRWVSKDGIGALGRFFIGGRFGSLFDNDPKQWRMYADLIGSAGSIFDLTTQMFPEYFLPLASCGNLTKAVASGLKDPSFRVIQNHFAKSENLGEVSAKEEVWEVTAQLLGLALGILILDTQGLVGSFPSLCITWFSVRILHLWLRFKSLSFLEFDTINMKRCRMLVKLHTSQSSIPGIVECNRNENILMWEIFGNPKITYNAPLICMVDTKKSLKQLLSLYYKESYIMAMDRKNGVYEFLVSFKIGATGRSVMRCLWQVYWLYENKRGSDCIEESLNQLEMRFDDFFEQLQIAGWNTSQINIKVPNSVSIDLIGK